ncbi:MAG: hypothetical protein HZA08_10350 [Nitrospirae bacterium]|nr:hypothetical protein [Nitrospirota bacterium]
MSYGDFHVKTKYSKYNLLLILIPVYFLIYFSINHLLEGHNLMHPYLLFYGEKALLALNGVPPRLENIGFIYPPLPIVISLLFMANISITQGFIASLISAFISWEIINNIQSKKLAITLIFFLIFSIPILFLATQRFDLYLHFFFIIYSIKLLYQYVRQEYSLYIFTAGPLFGLSFFTHFSSIYLIPWIFIIIFFLYRKTLRKFMAVSFVYFSPYFLFFLSFAYLNWVFTGKAFGFLPNYKLLFSNSEITAAISAGSITGSLWFMLSYLLKVILIIAPFLAGIFYEKRLVSLIPFLVIFSLIYSNLFYPAIYVSSIFIIYFLILMNFEKKEAHNVFIAAMVISLTSSFILALNSNDAYERKFTHALTGSIEENTGGYKQIAEILKYKKGKILIDDQGFYPVVYLMKDPERFILPYQYEFNSAIANPALFADYVIGMKDKNMDKVYRRFEYGVKGYYTIFENKDIIIWEKTKLRDKTS